MKNREKGKKNKKEQKQEQKSQVVAGVGDRKEQGKEHIILEETGEESEHLGESRTRKKQGILRMSTPGKWLKNNLL